MSLPVATKTKGFQTVDQYLAAQPPHVRPALEKVRRTLQKALPKAEEVISYQIPAYKLGGRIVIFFAGWKEHCSLYPLTAAVLAEVGADPEKYEVNDKGTLKLPLSKPMPVGLIAKLARYHARRAEEASALKAAKKKAPAKARATKKATKTASRPTKTKPAAREKVAAKRPAKPKKKAKSSRSSA